MVYLKLKSCAPILTPTGFSSSKNLRKLFLNNPIKQSPSFSWLEETVINFLEPHEFPDPWESLSRNKQPLPHCLNLILIDFLRSLKKVIILALRKKNSTVWVEWYMAACVGWHITEQNCTCLASLSPSIVCFSWPPFLLWKSSNIDIGSALSWNIPSHYLKCVIFIFPFNHNILVIVWDTKKVC